MQKSVSLILIFLFLTGISVCAAEIICEEDNNYLPKTYIDSGIDFFDEVHTEFKNRLISAWENLSTEVYLYDLGISTSICGDLYRKVLYENPKYYYVSGGFRYSRIGTTLYSILPDYTETDKAVIADTMNEIEIAAEKILMHIDDDMTEFEKVMTVHDYMVINYEYDETYTNYSVTIMTTGTGVCMSYALAFNLMMNKLGIESAYVASDEMEHAWNLVKVDGEWYHIDLTWNDPLYDRFAQTRHSYDLLSTERIMSLEKPHYGFDLGDAVADSTLYDDAGWRDSRTSIITVDGVNYRVEGKNLVREDGKVIYKNLDGGDSLWNISKYSGFSNTVLSGLAEYDGVIYFNTDSAIYTYDVKTEVVEKIKTDAGICGLFVDENTLRYGKYDSSTEKFCEAGSSVLGNLSVHAAINGEGKLHITMIKETDDPVMIISFGGGACGMEKIEGTGFVSADFDAAEEQTVFFWDENLRPLKPKQTVKLH